MMTSRMTSLHLDGLKNEIILGYYINYYTWIYFKKVSAQFTFSKYTTEQIEEGQHCRQVFEKNRKKQPISLSF